MNAHTPGPWQLDMDNEEEPSVFVPCKGGLGSFEICPRVGGEILGEPEYDDYSQVHANAKLIAAAPDLLAALIALRDAIKDHPDFQTRETLPLGMQVNAALAKAQP